MLYFAGQVIWKPGFADIISEVIPYFLNNVIYLFKSQHFSIVFDHTQNIWLDNVYDASC